jgi:hypothetical protein
MAVVVVSVVVAVQAQAAACFKHWTRAEAGTSGGRNFTGITNGTGVENYDNPLFYALADAQTGLSSLAKGRLSASIPTTTYIGPMTFDFFAAQNCWARIFPKRRKNQLVITFTKGTNAGFIKSGRGCYQGFSDAGGTATRTYINGTWPKVFEWNFCPAANASCSPK